ncbi:MAG: 3-hydroxybenzoate 4-monooxygenase, partial [Alphaproteobacteria bacterium]
LRLQGDSANQMWGVMDVLAVTDFPDIRLKSAIHSANEGSLLVIPREGGYLVRLYVELDKLNENERAAHRQITIDRLIDGARRILCPYSLDVKEVAWWSVYEIGQRLCERFDDVPAGAAGNLMPRVFIAGDACHTHSPKAGQGMNVSMQDAFNLGWKLAAVLRGRSRPELLHSYSSERQAIAKELIDFDRDFARMFSAQPRDADHPNGVDPAEFERYFVKQGRFTAGTASVYAPSMLTGAPTHQHLAKGFGIGTRFHSAPVIRLADARPMHLGHVLQADGRWRILIFAGREIPHALCDALATDPNSPLCQYTPHGADPDSVFDIRAVFQQNHRELDLTRMPDLLMPKKGPHGLIDYEKMFCPDTATGNDIFDLRGIDRDAGCMVVVRPDQYIAQVLPLHAFAELTAFFKVFMVPA